MQKETKYHIFKNGQKLSTHDTLIEAKENLMQGCEIQKEITEGKQTTWIINPAR